jgi:hypothetical protein
MANTVIQLKFSTLTAAPTSLNVAEPAYSYASNTLFIGSPDGTGSIAIGGKFYIDRFDKAYNHANAAFDLANTVANAGADIYARNHANSAFIQANASFATANSGSIYANGAFAAANSAGIYANGAFAKANNEAGVNNTQNTNITTAQNTATAAFIRANNSLDANNGGTIAGNLSITGNLSVLGNTFTVSSSQIVANDSLIILGAGNYTSDILDIGFAGHYNDGVNAHTGFIRDAGTKEYQLFEGYTQEIGANNNININDASFRIATLRANLKSQSITLNGEDLQTLVTNSYNAANAAFISANNINGVNLSQNTNITAAFNQANAAFAAANAAGSSALVQYAANHANAAFNQANTDFTTIATTAGYYGNGATIASFTLEANGRISQANSTLIGISASQITSGTLGVARGGTGAGSFTTNGVLLGQGTSALTTASSSTEGHVLTINNTGVPTFAHLSGGTF